MIHNFFKLTFPSATELRFYNFWTCESSIKKELHHFTMAQLGKLKQPIKEIDCLYFYIWA